MLFNFFIFKFYFPQSTSLCFQSLMCLCFSGIITQKCPQACIHGTGGMSSVSLYVKYHKYPFQFHFIQRTDLPPESGVKCAKERM